MGLMLAGYDADEAMVISSWIYITRQALKESGYGRDDVIHDPERQQAEAVYPPLPFLADLNYLSYDDFKETLG